MKWATYTLIFVLFFVSAGTSICFFLELENIRAGMKKTLETDNNKIELLFTKEAFAHIDWTQKDKEFRFKGRMYDVASTHIIGQTVHVSCVFDKEETGLRKTLKDFFTPSSDKNSPLRKVVRMFSQKYVAYLIDTAGKLNNFLIFFHKPYLFPFHIFEIEPTGHPPKA